MKYQRTDSFVADYAHLSDREREMFRAAVRQMNAAYAARDSHRLPHWPASLRVRHVEGTHGIFEMTWSFAGPDGRATFEIITVDEEPAIKWRRIGDHGIFREP